jgi:hypothetical protein
MDRLDLSGSDSGLATLKGWRSLMARCGRYVMVLSVLAMVCASVPSAVARSNDRATTHAYLADVYAYTQAVVAAEPAVLTAYESAANKLSAECPGVLAAAPQESFRELFSDESKKTARQRGEASRQGRQLRYLDLELIVYLSSAELEIVRPLRLVFAQEVAALRWSEVPVTRRVHADATNSLSALLEVPNVCADMRAWVASGYRSLSPNTNTLVKKLFASIRHEPEQPTIESLLKPYEGPSEKALTHKIKGLLHAAAKLYIEFETPFKRAHAELGFVTHSRKEAERLNGPPKGSVRVGGGKTAVGSKYTVWVEPHSDSHEPGCRVSVTLVDAHYTDSGVCLSGARIQRFPNVECGSGTFTTEALVAPDTRLVRLRLSNGKQISSRPVIVPASLGGPAALYYQVTHGPTPIPESLTEIGAHGKKLRTVKLPHTECDNGPEFLPGSRTLARGRIPHGSSFKIVGERYRFHKQVEFELSIEIQSDALSSGGGEAGESSGQLGPPRGPFEPKLSTGCEPHEYSIVYGVLDAAHDTVEARVGTKLYQLHRVKIPRSLHAGPVLAYIALEAVPDKLIVRSPNGKIVQAEDLATRAKEVKETCEGESEEPGAPPSA